MELINIKTKQLVLATTAALAGTVLMTSAKANADTTVTVQSGDTVWGLSQEYQVSMASIVQANQLANPDLIYVGDQLTIPTSAAKSSQKASSATAQQTAAAAPASQATSASATAVTVTLPLSATPSAATSSSAAQLATTSANQLATTPRVENNGSTSVSLLAAAPATSTANVATTAVNVASTTPVTSTPAVNNSTNTAVTSAASTAPTTSAAAGTATNGVTTYTPSEAVARAQSVEGTPYVWGGNTTSGFDCSGLVQWSYGLSSDYRTTYQQQALGTHQYDIANAPAGAIYFWGSDSAPYHDAIATGNGNYIAAPDVGQTVSTSSINYYTPNYYVVVGQ
ncbi:C40 family peptidase [Limosilactobacillus ingluviei]|uniref:C40 family peptidase n=1 Tax=Limosilactobacillus ingluviei TaxID=148604 RepID=UPI0023EFC994|nr:C40 family peptidase [Limosilactobacillus ingluviei]